jgi:hypothetical protein
MAWAIFCQVNQLTKKDIFNLFLGRFVHGKRLDVQLSALLRIISLI